MCIENADIGTCLYSSVVERQSCKLKVLGSIPSGGSLVPLQGKFKALLLVSWCPGVCGMLLVSWCPGVLVSWCPGVRAFELRLLLVSWYVWHASVARFASRGKGATPDSTNMIKLGTLFQNYNLLWHLKAEGWKRFWQWNPAKLPAKARKANVCEKLWKTILLLPTYIFPSSLGKTFFYYTVLASE